ncbi:MAG: hypothetical protein IKZ46_03635 [Victivallales bacterium]|nr:hypothetical protein [Victivallales bacterium]
MNEFIEYVKEVNYRIGFERGFERGFKRELERILKHCEERGIKLDEELSIELGKALGEEKVKVTVVMNMLRNGRDEKEIQMALGLPADQIAELIRCVQTHSQEYLGK